jgi:predicted nuclease with TOPRIM domain
MSEDLYQRDSYDNEDAPAEYAEIIARMARLDDELRKTRKKKKNKKGKKYKKLKKRLNSMERERENLRSHLVQPPKPWWLGTLDRSLPKLIDFASIVYQTRAQERALARTANGTRLLTDGRDRK